METTGTTSMSAATWPTAAGVAVGETTEVEAAAPRSGEQRRVDEGTQLRARLLKMIVANESSRKNGSDAIKPR